MDRLVVKFSRVAQDVPLTIVSPLAVDEPRLDVAQVVFNGPFQEFGLLEELRNSAFGPADLRILTKRPLAIYSPGKHYEPWQLGRVTHRFRRHGSRLNAEQATQDNDNELIPLDYRQDRRFAYQTPWKCPQRQAAFPLLGHAGR